MRRDWGGPFGVVTGGEMAALDRKAIEEYGIPAAALMERAGAEVARAVAEFAGDAIAGARVQVVCGTGNNGGDGFVAARTLANLGARVRISLVSPPERLRGDALAFYTAAVKMGVPVATIGEGDLRKFTLALRTADVIVDAILGTGSSGPLRPFVARLVAAINESQRPVIAVDLPTGVQADTGRVDPIAVKAKMTVAFGLPKVGHLLNPGRAYTGELRVAEIGFPRPLLDSATGRLWADKSWARTVFAPRPAHGHKGTFGRVVVIAGSYGMAGAAALAMNGALRSGRRPGDLDGARESATRRPDSRPRRHRDRSAGAWGKSIGGRSTRRPGVPAGGGRGSDRTGPWHKRGERSFRPRLS